MGLTRFTQNGQIINLRDNRLAAECLRINGLLSQAVERLIILGMKVEASDYENTKKLVEQYNSLIWPNISECHTCLKPLATSIRASIDECQVSDSRLTKLLELNRFQLEARQITDELIEKIGRELEIALEVKRRARVIDGIQIDPEKMIELQTYKNSISKWQL
ncbi:unnamed protein product [Bursaphelenchus okinawaensis]|uniref:Uncharacterized protein n=1 Tax=Bursaphelenchus okinawaensis TaxID=465554 RepID=A0A811KC28_9BILA|nr:unnamed protein product [Bursaphelenchus okinawaensis]CAG9098008.1 unnamed protein product [Bursaphelenchus okinawaensis]